MNDLTDATAVIPCRQPLRSHAHRSTSRLAQAPIAHTCLVEVERFEGDPPAVTAFDPPEII